MGPEAAQRYGKMAAARAMGWAGVDADTDHDGAVHGGAAWRDSTLGLLPAAGEQRREGHSQPLCRPQPIPALRRKLPGLAPAEWPPQLCLTNPFVTDLPPQAPVKTATAPEPRGVAQECWKCGQPGHL